MELVKGVGEYTGIDAVKRQRIKGILSNIFRTYGFELSETPIIEFEDFVRGENNNDEAVSDVFRFEDKGKRKLALRYEFTFQLKRTASNKKLPYKRYQIGEVFRDEPTTGNRFRQFTQCDVDTVGSSIKEEAEILSIASEIMKELGIKATIYINNRKLLNEIMNEQKIDEKNKKDVIREIDKLDKLSEKEVKDNLKKYKAEKVLEIFKKPEKYFEKYESYREIKELKYYCKIYGIKITFLPSLARGLSYYNGNIFEIKTSEMKETICGGGSYMVNGIQSTGISFGVERLYQLAKIEVDEKRVLIISIGKDKEAIKLAESMRKENVPCLIMYGKPSKALEYANSYKIEKVIFIGEEEVKKKKYTLKNMKIGKEESLSETEILKKLLD
ncbi:MAG: ATP phosphoribosyltransferase regulatory subunit [archaeon]|nr:ATP phosphoribosyltransferase regulatory subunit [archaeon]